MTTTIDQGKAEAEREGHRRTPAFPPMSSGLKAWLVILTVLAALSAAYMVGGFIVYRDEVNARIQGQCHVISLTRGVLADLVRFGTKPADTTGLTPERLEVVLALNATRRQARADYLPRVQRLVCDSSS